MKKIFNYILVFTVFSLCLISFGCKKEYTVKIYIDGELKSTHIVGENDSISGLIPEITIPVGHDYSWHTENTTDAPIADFTQAITSDVDFYCIFTKKTFTVKFIDIDNTTILEQQYQYMDTLQYPTVNDKEINGVTYVFQGFDKEITTVEEDLVINAVYKDYYTITFYDGDDQILSQQKLPLGATIVAPDDPVKEDNGNFYYVFDGWDTEFDVVTGNMEIYPYFIRYTHTFYSAKFYNENEKLLEEIFVRDDELVKTNLTMSKKGTYKYTYNFIGWATDQNLNELFDFSKPIPGNTNFYPVFEEVLNTVEFDFTKAVVSILGDSISTFYAANSTMNSYYGGENEYYYPIFGRTVGTAYDTWWGKLIYETQSKFGVNASLSGSTCYNWGSDSAPGPAMNDTRIKLLGENGKPDIILIYIGTNDNVNGFTTDQFRNAYETMLNKISLRYPNAYVFCLTMGYCNYSGYSYTESNRLSFNKIIKDVAMSYNAQIVDIASVQTQDTYKSMLGDSLHPSKEGMSIIGQEVIRVVKEFFTLE